MKRFAKLMVCCIDPEGNVYAWARYVEGMSLDWGMQQHILIGHSTARPFDGRWK